MRLSGERLLMGLLLAGLPVAMHFFLFRPSLQRHRELHRRIQAAHDAFPRVQAFTPLSREERALLEAPDAPWRSRIPWVAGDGARLAHVNRVVSEVGAAMRARGVRVRAIRAILDPVSTDFTFPAAPVREAALPAPVPDDPGHTMAGWVLELEVAGATGELFRAASVAAGMKALLEPVGLRWEAAGGKGEARQYLLLRNLYLRP